MKVSRREIACSHDVLHPRLLSRINLIKYYKALNGIASKNQKRPVAHPAAYHSEHRETSLRDDNSILPLSVITCSSDFHQSGGQEFNKTLSLGRRKPRLCHGINVDGWPFPLRKNAQELAASQIVGNNLLGKQGNTLIF